VSVDENSKVDVTTVVTSGSETANHFRAPEFTPVLLCGSCCSYSFSKSTKKRSWAWRECVTLQNMLPTMIHGQAFCIITWQLPIEGAPLSINQIGAAVYQWCEFKSHRGKNKIWQLKNLVLTLFGLIFRRIYTLYIVFIYYWTSHPIYSWNTADWTKPC
jgi:hypothetical protein